MSGLEAVTYDPLFASAILCFDVMLAMEDAKVKWWFLGRQWREEKRRALMKFEASLLELHSFKRIAETDNNKEVDRFSLRSWCEKFPFPRCLSLHHCHRTPPPSIAPPLLAFDEKVGQVMFKEQRQTLAMLEQNFQEKLCLTFKKDMASMHSKNDDPSLESTRSHLNLLAILRVQAY
ncbi:hypothetical protein Tco_1361238 [Tanacetum coccineum]